jgi:hypothetical protein
MKDLARLSVSFDSPDALVTALETFKSTPGWTMEVCKNKYASPTPLGYADGIPL